MTIGDTKSINKKAIQQVIKDYFEEYYKNLGYSIPAFILPALANVCVAYLPPLVISKLVDHFIKQGTVSFEGVLPYLLIFTGFWFFGEMIRRVGIYLIFRVEGKGIANLSKKSFSKLLSKDYSFYSDNYVGSLTKRSNVYASNFEQLTDLFVIQIGSNVIPLFFVFYILWGYSPFLPLLLLFCITIGIFIGLPAVRKRAKLVAARHVARSKMMGILSDTVTNIISVKSFAGEDGEVKKYGKRVDEFQNIFLKAGDYHNFHYDMVIAPIYILANVLGLVSAIYFAYRLGLSAGTVVLVFSYFAQSTQLLWQAGQTYRNFEYLVSEAAEFTEMFIEPPMISDKTDAKMLPVPAGKIEFKNVTFSYPNGEECLSDFNLIIPPGGRVGLVGPSGGGKSTITKLFMRFLDPTSGTILIDDEDISTVTQQSLRLNIAYVPQEPMLFHRSVMENISYGKPDATEEEILKAAEIAYVNDFVKDFPDGYQTTVGERGTKLSGGQRQRISIARAILCQNPILVLDEATSALDSESERYIQKGLHKLMEGKTSLVIAHRLSTIRHLDRIIVLDKGKIVQSGTHEELLQDESGLYTKLWNIQSDNTTPELFDV